MEKELYLKTSKIVATLILRYDEKGYDVTRLVAIKDMEWEGRIAKEGEILYVTKNPANAIWTYQNVEENEDEIFIDLEEAMSLGLYSATEIVAWRKKD